LEFEICTITRAADWRHVPGQENSADLPSRGCRVSKLLETKWWEGPSWLRLAEENWPRAESTAKEGRKCWIIVFSCAVYRNIHLELVTSLSTKVFLLGLRRFIARRGRPKVIYSDNGTNFVGADNLFKPIDWAAVEVDASLWRIQWKFNPPTAAWWGGWWEHLIQMVKKLLRRVLGHASLSYKETMNIICDCEETVNSRPLTYITEDS
jgi:hypothetical protein